MKIVATTIQRKILIDRALRGGEKKRRPAHSVRPPARRPSYLFLQVEIDAFPQFLSRLEVRHILFGHLDLLARLRIAPGPRRPIIQAEAAEPADLDALALREAFRHRV